MIFVRWPHVLACYVISTLFLGGCERAHDCTCIYMYVYVVGRHTSWMQLGIDGLKFVGNLYLH